MSGTCVAPKCEDDIITSPLFKNIKLCRGHWMSFSDWTHSPKSVEAWLEQRDN